MKTTRKSPRSNIARFGVVGRACALAATLALGIGTSHAQTALFTLDHNDLPEVGASVTAWGDFDKTQGNPVVVELAGEKWSNNP